MKNVFLKSTETMIGRGIKDKTEMSSGTQEIISTIPPVVDGGTTFISPGPQ